MQKTLITGGAGYIGSHAAKALSQLGREVVVLDSLVAGHRDFLKWGEFENGDLADPAFLKSVFSKHDIGEVLHFAAFIAVGESVEKPELYYGNNVRNTLNLLDAMMAADVKRLVFSSTAAVYGEPVTDVIAEDHPLSPLSPYAWSKRMIEQILADFDHAYGLKHVCLRYFNAAGADLDGEIGERHQPETHLIPLILHAALGLRDNITIFGTDYPTPDGTCLRDYIHVTDLADAHVKALEYLIKGGDSRAFNLGNGNGFSVREIIDVAREVSGREIPVTESTRRPGDSPALVSSAAAARDILGWKPQFGDVRDIVRTAWNWHQKDLA
ncbi:UDP-glucose 4-epimerase GalE [Pseudodesulfovibrio sediminis]|uniref:UDP-glucose 4-epimerase n=1 Tax=Pseudodesulfovibrio sediminis TaxID=2810563 RepID=A0ABM7P782_9BACT|nr:UDP-glucose 4-epimerase GalE [Pseudodesulfovibrio sediminis]BCS88842.1 UDP-glucose 4-epimerase GalE [Pseudodesulfovibrio sediminis]